MVVGDKEELGGWSLDKGLELKPSSKGFPLFSGTANLPPSSKVEFKYVIARAKPSGAGVQSQWEAANRVLQTTTDKGAVRDSFIENRATDPRITDEPFQLTAQEWTRWYRHHVRAV
jgi:hypothetical protein